MDNRNTPATLLGHWAFRGGVWKNYNNTGILRFAPAPALQLNQLGQIGNKRLGTDFFGGEFFRQRRSRSRQ